MSSDLEGGRHMVAKLAKKVAIYILIVVLALAVMVFVVLPITIELLAYRGTISAPRYTEKAFREVELGMKPEQVLSLLGPPLDKYDGYPSVEVWTYTKQENDESWWHVREVVFDEETMRVVEVHRYTREP